MSRELMRLRARIDRLDRVLVRRLAERQRLVEAVALLKADPCRVRDPARMERVLANVERAAAVEGLSAAIARPVWRELMDRSAEHEAALLRGFLPAGPPDACCGCRDGTIAPAQGGTRSPGS